MRRAGSTRWIVVAALFAAINVIGMHEVVRALRQRGRGLQLEAFQPEGRVGPDATFTIAFSEPMVSRERLGQRFTTELVTFQPPIRGEFEWRDVRTLRFFPAQALPRATPFVATVSADHRSLNGQALSDDAVFHVHTPPLELKGAWQTDTSNFGRVTLALEFNDKVSPEEVASHLKLTSPTDAPVAFTSDGAAPSRRVTFTTRPYKGKSLRMFLPEGFRGLSGPLGLAEDLTRVVTLEPDLRIREVDGRAGGLGDVCITVSCSQHIDPERAAAFIAVQPETAFDLTDSWRGLRLEGEFEPGKRYRVTFRKGLPATNGSVLEKDVTRTVVIPDYSPSLAFDTSGFYLSAAGSLLLPLDTVNITKAHLTIEKVYANNVVHALRQIDGDDDRLPRDLSRVVVDDTYDVTSKTNRVLRKNLDLRGLLGDTPQGIFLVRAKDDDSYWRDTQKLIFITDLALSVKRSPADLLVWVSALSTTKPVEGVTVTVWSRTSQEILRGVTDASGVAHFKDATWREDLQPFLVAATKGPDSCYLKLADGHVDTSDLAIDGRKYLRRGYEAFVYTDRGIYRPGETVHLRGIVRGAGAVAPSPFPVQFRIDRPDGRRFRTLPAKLSQWGTAEVDLEVPLYAPTGRYTAQVRLPNAKQAIGSVRFQVEEFLPDRLKAEVDAEERRYRGGETLEAAVTASHLFGSPAAGRRVTARTTLAASSFEHEYRFADRAKQFATVRENLGAVTLDENGKGTLAVELPKELTPQSALTVYVVASVHEVGGRAVTASLSREVDIYPHYVGIARERKEAAEANRQESFRIALITPNGERVPAATLKAEFSRIVWNTVTTIDGRGRCRYVSKREVKKLNETTCAIANGVGTVAATPPRVGLYSLRVADPASGASADLEFYCDGHGYVPWAREKPNRLELVPHKKAYAPGETARVLIKSPFPGQALVTVEGDRVHLTRLVTLAENTGEVTFPVAASLGPNAYCTATVVRKLRRGAQWAPHRAFGTEPIHLDNTGRRLSVELSAPEESRPDGPVRVAIRVRDAAGAGAPAEVALAAVDEGICRLTRFQTPDPWGFFFAKRALDVASADVYSMLMPEVDKKAVGADSAPGGGDDLEVRLLNPVRAERVKPVALWASRIETAADGTAEVVLDLPHFNGQLRLMAVAAGESDFGAVDTPVLVKQPLMVRATFPRFLAPGDSFALPAAVFNNTGHSGTVQLTIAGDAGFEFSPNARQALRIEEGRDETAVFHVRAPGIPGAARLTLTASLGDETTVERVEIPVRPPATLTFRSGSGAVKAGQVGTVAVPGGWVKGTAGYSLSFSATPEVRLGSGLRYLLRYPYGCVEQSTSAAFPLLYLSEVAKLADPDLFAAETAEQYVQAGIHRVVSMQTYSGGFGCWPGTSRPYPWGTAYATHFLVEARKAGFAVYKDNLEAALGYLDRYLGTTDDDEDTRPVKAYACFVLALAGKPNASWTYRLHENRDALPLYSRAHLAGALALLKEHAMARNVVAGLALPADDGAVDTGGLLHSPAREAAILLSVYTDLDPDHRHIPTLVRRIEKGMKADRWRSTQENAFVLLGLGKHLRRIREAGTDFTAEVTLDGEPFAKLTHKDRLALKPDGLGGRRLHVAVQGKGTLYYYWTAEGIPAAGRVPEKDSGLRVRRRFHSRDGKPLDPRAIPHGEVVLVELTVRSDRRVKNVAISDLLPAGFEIENPRVATSDAAHEDADSASLTHEGTPPELAETAFPFPTSFPRLGRAVATPSPRRRLDALLPDRVEMRDDRLLLFADLGRNRTYAYRYVARAVTKGSFTLPPVSASAMYDPDLASVHGAGTVEVVDAD